MTVFMLVDDDKDDRAVFAESLKFIDPDIVCITCKSGADALDRLRTEKTLPDVVFLDINMPGMSGWEVLRTVKRDAALKSVPVIMFSTSSHQRDVQIAADFGASGFCTKPEDVKDLHKVQRFVAQHLDQLSESTFANSGIPYFKKVMK